MQQTALLIIDVQKAIDHPSWGRRNNPDAEKNIQRHLQHYRKHQLELIHVQHLSTDAQSTYRPNQEGCDFKEEVQPLGGEKIIQKSVQNAFINTDLEAYLKAKGLNELLITGVITNNSVEASARMASNLGFKTSVIEDATATFDKQDLRGRWHTAETVHALSLANLKDEYADVRSTQDILERNS